MNSAVSRVLGFLGWTGTGLATNNLIQAQPNPQPSDIKTFEEFKKVANPDIWSSYNTVMRRPTTFEESLQLWNEMANWDLLAAALTAIVDEATQYDGMSPATMWYECNDPKVEEDLNEMLLKINTEEILPSQVWHISAFGNSFEKLDYAIGEGVMGTSFVHPLDIRRYWLERNRRCIGYRWLNHSPSKDEVFKLPGLDFSRVGIDLGKGKTEDLFYPWDFMHFRRMYRLRTSEHGEPLFEEATGIYKKLRIALDQMVVHRAQVQPDRYVIDIDVKDQSVNDQFKTIQRWKNSLRSNLAFGKGKDNPFGALDEFKSFYNTMSLDTILWLAKPNGFNHSIEKLAGTASVPDVHDIELMTNLFFAIIGMPKSWMGLTQGDTANAPVSGKALLAQDMKFLRKIKSIRRPVINAYQWLGYFHAALKDYDIQNLVINAHMPPIGSLEDQLKLEMLKLQAEVLDNLADVMEKFSLPREAWIDLVFKKYMRLPDDVVHLFMTSLPPEAEATIESKQKTPSERKIIEDIISKNPEASKAVSKLHDILDGNLPKHKPKRYRNVNEIFASSSIKENDLIVSGYGQKDPLNEFKPVDLNSSVSSTMRDLLESHIKRNGP